MPHEPGSEGWRDYDLEPGAWMLGDEDNPYEARIYATEDFEDALGYAESYCDGVVLRMLSDLGWESPEAGPNCLVKRWALARFPWFQRKPLNHPGCHLARANCSYQYEH
jgi:hypothetical protein